MHAELGQGWPRLAPPAPSGSPGRTALKINTEEIAIPLEKHLGAFRRLLCGIEKTFPPSSLLLLPPPSSLARVCSLLGSTEADPQGMRHLSRKFLPPAKKERWLSRGAGRGEESSSLGMDICRGGSRREVPAGDTLRGALVLGQLPEAAASDASAVVPRDEIMG